MRAAVLGNGRLYLGWDSGVRLREMFWPEVGLLNHLQENRRNRLVLWSKGQFYDIGGDGFAVEGEYLPGMSFRWILRHNHIPIQIRVEDRVDPYLPVWARTVQVSLPLHSDGTSALYSVQAYALGENTVGEEASFDCERGRLYHFKGRVWVAIKVRSCPASPPAAHRPRAAVAKLRDGGVRFSHHDGDIHGARVDHGFVESAIGLTWQKASSFSAEYMLAFGRDREEADGHLDLAGDHEDVAVRTKRYWSRHEGRGAVSVKALATHCDRDGGALASCDTDIMGDYRDHYRYVWPRDAAMCVASLLRAGLPEYARRYLGFCARAIDPQGFFHQRYRTDATRGSGWHPWRHPSHGPPFQEDETALSLVTAGHYLDETGDLHTLQDVYLPFVEKAARFVLEYTSHDGTLVRPSYDLWEERRGVFAFTQASCVAGLSAAARIAEALGRKSDEEDFRRGAGLLLQGLIHHLSAEDWGYFRGFLPEEDGAVPEPDRTDDASLFLIPVLLPEPGAAAPGERGVETAWERSLATWKRLKVSLAVRLPGRDVPGYARYSGDWYMRPEDAYGLPGNSWLVTTAWFALAGARLGLMNVTELGEYVSWFSGVSTKSGLLPEQLCCRSGRPLSVAPLAWSHAMHLDLMRKEKDMQESEGRREEPPNTLTGHGTE